ncbi:MAG: hypothetical protein NTW16_13480 [Bacteroidetes bacterium]|nr:hypothetical protein [Bacteroidota bacterium]
MKEEIKNYFRTDRSHSAGVALIIKHSNRLSLKKQVNIHPASEYMIGVIHEELRELAGIHRDELHDLLQLPIAQIIPADQPEAIQAVTPHINPESTEASTVDIVPKEKKASRKK